MLICCNSLGNGFAGFEKMRISKKKIKKGAVFIALSLLCVFLLSVSGNALGKAFTVSAWGYLPGASLYISDKDSKSYFRLALPGRTSDSEIKIGETSSQEESFADTTPTGGTIGSIVKKHYASNAGGVFLPYDGGALLKNVTSIPHDEVREHMRNAPDLKIETGTAEDAPQVLIYHTHTTESFEYVDKSTYDSAYNARTRDKTRNMVAVGDRIVEKLKAAGIMTVHDDTEHDFPSYTGAYERSAETIKRYLEKYPSIKVMIDVHRDAISGDDGTRFGAVADVGGKKAAQLMIISGADNGKLNFPNFFSNLAFSSAVQTQLEEDSPGLTRPILFDYRKYNQNLLPNSFLLEVGSHGNCLTEAFYSADLFGDSLAKVLLKYS